MSRWVLPIRQADRLVFDLLKSGQKKIETRAGGKYDGIKAGDTVVYTCGEEKLERQVKSVRKFGSIDELFAVIPVSEVMPWVETTEEAVKVYHGFPGYAERIAEKGIIAFEMKS